MQANNSESAPPGPLGSNFWKFWTGQSISNLGSAFTMFALPLLVFKQTNSAINLGIATGVTFLPYLLFGLLIGTWVDRTDRKRLMIFCDLIRAVAITSMGALMSVNALPIWLIYAIMFLNSTLTIGFSSAQMAAVPNIVSRDQLLIANSRLQSSYSIATVAGPLIAAVLISFAPLQSLLFIDGLSFLISAYMLASITISFNSLLPQQKKNLRDDLVDGVRYVIDHPVLRVLSLMTALLVFVVSTVNSQIVLFAKEQLGADDPQVGLMYTASGIGMVIFSFLSAYLRRSLSFGMLVLSVAIVKGVVLLLLGLTHSYWIALVLWGFSEGLTILFAINTTSLRQTIVPGHMLGRVMSISQVISWSAIPIGTFAGGYAIERLDNVGLVYVVIGVAHTIIPLVFIFSPLGNVNQQVIADATGSAAN